MAESAIFIYYEVAVVGSSATIRLLAIMDLMLTHLPLELSATLELPNLEFIWCIDNFSTKLGVYRELRHHLGHGGLDRQPE